MCLFLFCFTDTTKIKSKQKICVFSELVLEEEKVYHLHTRISLHNRDTMQSEEEKKHYFVSLAFYRYRQKAYRYFLAKLP